ncbi:MAG TPA: hypothetical protein VK155_16065 [Bacteroidales bacterium]|jgi:hypothetical protein|nr:hypothetical protein [Bacteroidales bacterium]
MNKKIASYASILIILVFIGYMVYDSVKPVKDIPERNASYTPADLKDAWEITKEFQVKDGGLKAVAVSTVGEVFIGGSSFIECLGADLDNSAWKLNTETPVSALAVFNDTLYASTMDQVLVIDRTGKMINEFGPFEKGCIITSISSNAARIAFADAGNRLVYIIDKGGEVKTIAGNDDPRFILPSAYFDVSLKQDNSFFVANTGHRRIESRNAGGSVISQFGSAGLAPENFCGCCNPAHFAVIPGGFVTAEKGLNRIKILNEKGEFVELVSSRNKFAPAVPLDVASADGKTIYAANPDDSKLYVFKRINP